MSSNAEKGIGIFLIAFTLFFWYTAFPTIINSFCTTSGCAFENLSEGVKPLVSTGGPVIIAIFSLALILGGVLMIIKD